MINELITKGMPAFGDTTKILLIEDMAEQRRVFIQALKPLGLKILEAGNAAEARALMNEDNVYLIICDLYLADTSGFELIKEFKQREAFRNTPFIVVTGSEEEADLKKMMELGANDFVRKPISIIEFISRVKAQLRLKRYLEEEKRHAEHFLRTNEQQITQSDVKDELTGIFNKNYCKEYLEKEINRCERYKTGFSTLLIRLESFQNYKENSGELTSSQIIQQLVRLISGNIRKSDVLCRIDENDLLVIFNQTEYHQAEFPAERIRELMNNDNYLENHSVQVGMGLTAFQIQDTVDSILKRSEKALKKLKNKPM